MGFNPFKMMAGAAKAVGGAAKKVVQSPVVRAAVDIAKPIYEIAVPDSAKKIVSKVAAATKLAKLITPKGATKTMNVYEQALRALADVAIAVRDKEGTTALIADVVGALASANAALTEFNRATVDEKRLMVREALDNCIGTEVDALFGPTGKLVKFDIPFLDDEKATDLALGPIVDLAIPDKSATDTTGN